MFVILYNTWYQPLARVVGLLFACNKLLCNIHTNLDHRACARVAHSNSIITLSTARPHKNRTIPDDNITHVRKYSMTSITSSYTAGCLAGICMERYVPCYIGDDRIPCFFYEDLRAKEILLTTGCFFRKCRRFSFHRLLYF